MAAQERKHTIMSHTNETTEKYYVDLAAYYPHGWLCATVSVSYPQFEETFDDSLDNSYDEWLKELKAKAIAEFVRIVGSTPESVVLNDYGIEE